MDIHGAPGQYLPYACIHATPMSCTGSQNGYDNSGQRTPNPTWAQNATNVALTLDIIRFIVKNVGGMIDIMELLNEPAGFMGDDFLQVLRQFWLDGYDQVRGIARPDLQIMIGDAFVGVDVRSSFPHTCLSSLTRRVHAELEKLLDLSDGARRPHEFCASACWIYVLSTFLTECQHQYQIFGFDQLARSFDAHISVSDSPVRVSRILSMTLILSRPVPSSRVLSHTPHLTFGPSCVC